MSATPNIPTVPDWVDLALDVLHESMRDDMRAAHERLGDLVDIYGVEPLYDVMCAWADTVGYSQGHKPGQPAPLTFYQSGTHAEITPEDAVPTERWAAWFIGARLARDRDTLHALISNLNNNADKAMAAVRAVLAVCGRTLRMTARGRQ